MKNFKKTNKLALQRELGLRQDPNATVFCSMNRFDPYQKGFALFTNAAEKFLLENPKAQLVIIQRNAANFPQINEWIEKMNDNPELKGRVYLPNKTIPLYMMARINAGSDFSIINSLYEPYGLTVLEAMKMGATVIGHGVDGIASAVLDPEINGTPEERAKWVVPDEKYGQTGIIMKPLPVRIYKMALAKQEAAYRRMTGTLEDQKIGLMQKIKDRLKMRSAKRQFKKEENVPESIKDWTLAEKMLPKSDQETLKNAQQNFDEAMNRAVQLTTDQDKLTQIRLNALKFVDEQHNWKRWAGQYAKAFSLADEVNESTWDATA
jgi:glycogen synthase